MSKIKELNKVLANLLHHLSEYGNNVSYLCNKLVVKFLGTEAHVIQFKGDPEPINPMILRALCDSLDMKPDLGVDCNLKNALTRLDSIKSVPFMKAFWAQLSGGDDGYKKVLIENNIPIKCINNFVTSAEYCIKSTVLPALVDAINKVSGDITFSNADEL